MEDALEKLKILDYERHFCEASDEKPLSRTQFAMPSSNPAANFPLYAALVQWLLASMGNFTDQWDLKFTDPNVTVTNMMGELRKVGINTDVPPHKLKQGHGSEVCQVLNNLVDVALQKKGFQFLKPQHHKDDYPEEDAPADMDDGPKDEIGTGGDMVDDAIDASDDEEEMFVSDANTANTESQDADQSMMESKVDPVAWKMELERVAPQLKVVLSSNSKEWRAHLEMAANLDKEISKDLPQMKESLETIVDEVAEAVEKISGREKIINQNFDHMVQEYRKVQEDLHQKQENYDKNSGSITVRSRRRVTVTGAVAALLLPPVFLICGAALAFCLSVLARQSLTNELATISEELDSVKSQMDSRGNSMTDTSPLLDIKKAMSRIKSEVKQMELRIGAVEHTLLQVALQNAGKGS